MPKLNLIAGNLETKTSVECMIKVTFQISRGRIVHLTNSIEITQPFGKK